MIIQSLDLKITEFEGVDWLIDWLFSVLIHISNISAAVESFAYHDIFVNFSPVLWTARKDARKVDISIQEWLVEYPEYARACVTIGH